MTVRLQRDTFSIENELNALTEGREDIGAAVTFTGYVRGTVGTRRLSAMTLEHYPGMAEAELERIIAEAKTRWPIDDARIIHRYGRLTPGEQIVLTITLSAHRQAAFEAGEFLMDFLKTNAPFWKLEEFEDGEASWVEAKEADDAARDRWTKS